MPLEDNSAQRGAESPDTISAPSITVDSKGRDPGARGPRDGGRKWRIVSKCDCSE